MKKTSKENNVIYPHWNFPTRRAWLQYVRKNWNHYKKAYKGGKGNVMSGSAFYPKEVYFWLTKTENEMQQMDKKMKEYYKNA